MKKNRTLVLVMLLSIAAACAVNPATGRRELMLVSESQEIQMGREADPQVSATYGLVDNPALQSYVSDLGRRLAATSERPGLPWSYKVVDDPIVNAFALPGGFIYVTRGILAYFNSEAELAGVLGHETGHVTARHSASQMSNQQLQQAGLMVGMIVSERFREYGGVAAAGLQILNLSYSRGDESEADRLGLRYITGVGYDPDAMIGVFQMLAEVGGGGEGRLPEWQLTHPYPENREAQMRAIIAESGMARDGEVGRDRYLDMIDGIVYGENPRHGYFVGSRFLHPDMAFELTFPTGWKTVNQTSVVAAIAPSDDAVVMLGVAEGGATPDAELRDFLRADGVTGGTIRQNESGGIRTARAPFEATTQDGVLSGEVAFVSYAGVTYRLVGYAAQANWSRHAAAVAATISSFGSVTDPQVLGVQPLQLRMTRVNEAMSLNSYVQRYPQPVSVEELAHLNRVSPGAVLSAGTRLKTVVGTPVG
jgi:predicted Zn-dependent protease